MKITSILLAGGQNKRMNGKPKWELQLGKLTMLDRSISKLKHLSKDILIVSGGNYTFHYKSVDSIKVQIVYDTKPYLGPLNGIYTGLLNSKSEWNFVIAADMPFLSIPLGKYMATIASNKGVSMVIPVWKGKQQPLHGLYGKSLLPQMKEALEVGKHGLIKWIESIPDVYYLQEEEVMEFNKNNLAFFNMNYPDEYQEALQLLDEEEESE